MDELRDQGVVVSSGAASEEVGDMYPLHHLDGACTEAVRRWREAHRGQSG